MENKTDKIQISGGIRAGKQINSMAGLSRLSTFISRSTKIFGYKKTVFLMKTGCPENFYPRRFMEP